MPHRDTCEQKRREPFSHAPTRIQSILGPNGPLARPDDEIENSSRPFRRLASHAKIFGVVVLLFLTSATQVFAQAEAAVEEVTGNVYWNESKNWFGLILLFVCGAIIAFILIARSGKELRIRKIAGLEAVDEAVGRATEMGRSVLFVPGIMDINEIQTIAGLTVLARVAGRAAEYGAKIEVPTSRSLVMTAAQETVEAAFISAGRQDAYNEDDIYYLTDEQFGYVAGVTGTMVRDKPAACFYMGCFFAESLILAETGNSIGAIQVAGTAMPSQLPFFVAACDYTLIGEEFFAASAYLSGEKQQLASLIGQDVGKLLAGVLILVGCGLATVVSISGEDSQAAEWLNYLTGHILST